MAIGPRSVSFYGPGSGGFIGGQRMDPRSQLAMQLMQQGSSTAPVQSPIEGLAKALTAGVGGYFAGQVRQEGKDREAAYGQDMAKLLAGGNAQPWVNPDTGEKQGTAGGFDGMAAALGGIDNPDVQAQMGPQIAMGRMQQQQAAADRAAAAQQQRDFYKFQQDNKAPGEAPTSIREYEYAKSQGYKGSFEEFKKLSGSQSQETFGNVPIWGSDANGNPVLLQPSSRGGAKQIELPPGVTPQRGQTSRVDLGDKFGLLDANGTLVGYIPKGIAPERKIDDGRVITLPGVPGGAPVSPQAGAPVQPAAPGATVPPVQVSGAPQAAPGAPAITDLPPTPEQERKARLAQEAKERAGDLVLSDIGRVLDLDSTSKTPVAGFGAETLSNISETGASDAKALLKSIRGNIGFDRLQQMRESSPTGGALGSVTEQELATLQSVLGNLEQSQSREQFRYNLKRLNNTYIDIVHGKGNGPARRALSEGDGAEWQDVGGGVRIREKR